MRFLKTIEVARLLRVSEETVRAMLRRGDLDGFRSGRSIRIRQESVERLVGERLNLPGDMTEERQDARSRERRSRARTRREQHERRL